MANVNIGIGDPMQLVADCKVSIELLDINLQQFQFELNLLKSGFILWSPNWIFESPENDTNPRVHDSLIWFPQH